MKRLNLILIILVGAVVLGVVTRISLTRAVQATKKGYVLVLQATEYDGSGKGTPVYTETRHVASNGDAYSIRQYTDGRKDETFSIVGRGVYARVGSKLNFLSGYDAPNDRGNLEKLRSSPNYVRTENVLGEVAAVLKTGSPDHVIELYRAPALGGDIIKMVTRTGGDGGTTTVLEPMSLTFVEPDPSLFKLPNLPVNNKNYEELHGSGQTSTTTQK